jgi:hypothetical protein
MTLGALTRTSAAAHSAAPAAKDGPLASSDMAEPETTNASPAMKTRNPAASEFCAHRMK